MKNTSDTNQLLAFKADSKTVRWGVMDDHGQVTECPSEHDAREYQALHGGELVSRATIHTSW